MGAPDRPLRIAVDCMGGDHAPQEIVRGALAAADAERLEVLLVGIPETLGPLVPAGVLRSGRAEVVPSAGPSPRARRRSNRCGPPPTRR